MTLRKLILVRTVIFWWLGMFFTVLSALLLWRGWEHLGAALLVSLILLVPVSVPYFLIALFAFIRINRSETAWSADWKRFEQESDAMWKKFCSERRPTIVGGRFLRSLKECVAIYDTIPRPPPIFFGVTQQPADQTKHGTHPCGDAEGIITEHDVRAMMAVSILDTMKDIGLACRPGIQNNGAGVDFLFLVAPLRDGPAFFMGTWMQFTAMKRNKVAVVNYQTSPAVFFKRGQWFGLRWDSSDISKVAQMYSRPGLAMWPTSCIMAIPAFLWSLIKKDPFASSAVRADFPLAFGLSADWAYANAKLSLERLDSRQLDELLAHTGLISERLAHARELAQQVIDHAIQAVDASSSVSYQSWK